MRRGQRGRRSTAAALLWAASVAGTTAVHAQRVVPSRTLALPVDDVRLDLHRARPIGGGPPTAMVLGRLVAYRGDSLVLVRPRAGGNGDTLLVAAGEVQRALVRRYSATRARLDTGGESAFYGTLAGALIGGAVAILTPVTRDRGVSIGAGVGLVLGFVGGLFTRTATAGYRFEPVTFRVEQ